MVSSNLLLTMINIWVKYVIDVLSLIL